MKTKLPRKLWKCVDLYILDIIKDLNTLPFVKTTLWSCAKCGPPPKYYYNFIDKTMVKQSWNSHTEVLYPYVCIVYNNSGWRNFHFKLSKIAKELNHYLNSYYTTNPFEITYYFNSKCPPSEWDKVRKLIKEYLK